MAEGNQDPVAVTHDGGDIHKHLDALHEHFLTERQEAAEAARAAHESLDTARNAQPDPTATANEPSPEPA